MVVNDSTDRKRIGETIVTSLKALGRPAELQVMEFGAYLARLRENKYDEMFMLSTIPQAPDPDASLHWLFYSKGTQGKFLGLPSDTDLDNKILKARASRDQKERDQLYNESLKQVVGDVYHIPQFWKNIVVAHNKKVDGLRPSPLWDWNLVTSFTNVKIVQQ
jgi:peptide/nickel transport system substrate-binding protein